MMESTARDPDTKPRRCLVLRAPAMAALSAILCVAEGKTSGAPLEKAGPNLAEAGDFEGGALKNHWKWNDDRGAFSVEVGEGRNGGSAAALRRTRPSDRGKFHTDAVMVPAGADLRISVWTKAREYTGGIWVNLEGPAAPKGAKFDIAGGTHAWTQYVYRTTIGTDKAPKGQMRRMEIWFYVYGEGTILLDDLEVCTIEPDREAEARDAERVAREIVDRASDSPRPRRPSNLQALAEAARGDEAVRGLDALVRAFATAVSRSGRWGALVAGPARRIFRDAPFRCRFDTDVRLEMARGEIEGRQLVLFAYGQDLTDVNVSAGELKGPGALAAETVQILPVAYGTRAGGAPIRWYEGHDTPDWPDPLLPNRPFTVKRGTLQPVYLRFRVARETPPGVYRGSVHVTTAAGEADVPIELAVHRTTVPVRLSIKTMMLGGSKGKHYLDLALEQHMGLGAIYAGMSWSTPRFPARENSFDFSKVERELQYAIDRGQSAFALAMTPKSGKWGFPKQYSPSWKATMSKVIREYGKWLRSKGWFDIAYYYNIDEPWSDRWEQVKELYAMAKAADPEVKVFSCVNKVGALEALKHHADTFDVYVQQHWQQLAPARRREGKEIWWAICIWPGEHPNLFIEYPLMDARIVGWMAFANDVSGFEYWSLVSWGGDWQRTGKKPPTDGSWITCPGGVLTTEWHYGKRNRNGDGYLCYPGDDGRPVNSLRFEALRDGLEEYELLSQLREKLPALRPDARRRAEALLAGGDGLVTNTHLYSTDDALLEARRLEVLRLLGGGR